MVQQQLFCGRMSRQSNSLDMLPLQQLTLSITSSCSRLATCMSSVISAIRCCRRRSSVGCTLGGRVSTLMDAALGTNAVRELAISRSMVGRNRLPA